MGGTYHSEAPCALMCPGWGVSRVQGRCRPAAKPAKAVNIRASTADIELGRPHLTCSQVGSHVTD